MLKKKLSLLFLMANISGCASFPKLHPYLISIKDQKCIEYEVQNQSDACNATYVKKQEWPLSHCDIYTALPPEDVAALLEYKKSVCTDPQ